MSNLSMTSQLIREVKDAVELDTKVQGASNMVIVALAAGLEGARDLMKNLPGLYAGQPEEVQTAVGLRLAQLLRVTAYNAEEIGEEYISELFKHLEALSMSNSHLVNRSLSVAVQEALQFLPQKDSFIALVQRLLNSGVTQQRSLCAIIIPDIYRMLPQTDSVNRPALGTAFGSLVSDADSFVRAQAAVGLTQLIKQALESGVVDKFAYSPSYIFVCYDRLVQDLSDGVRASNAGNGVQVLRFLLQLQKQLEQDARETKEIKEVLPALIKNISRGSSDRYWRVRMHCAQQMPAFFELISRKLDVQDCAVMFRLLSEDCEQDIRIQTIQNAPGIIKFLDQNTIIQIYCPALVGRAIDKEAIKVKTELAKTLGLIITEALQAPLTDECKQNVSQTIQECWRKLATDKAAEVRQEAVHWLGTFPASESKFIFESLTNVFQTKGEKWTVRLGIVKAVEELLSAQAPPKQQILQFIEDSIVLLNDDAYEVRAEFAGVIADVASKYTKQFFETGILDKTAKNARANTSSFQNRVSCASALAGVLQAMVEHNETEGFEIVSSVFSQYIQDPCLYVRQQAVAGMRSVLEKAADTGSLPPHVSDFIRKILQTAETDEAKEIQEEVEELLGVLEAFE